MYVKLIESKMKTKIISLSFIFCFSFDNSYGQTNNAYLELLGIGLMGSINYEKNDGRR